jgi:ubiquinone/menaquinone biosynthesis C-methylase UbiE
MTAKPGHLTSENAFRFQDQDVVDVYHFRLPYPQEVFEALNQIIIDTPRIVLDVGTGIGDIARSIAPLVDRVDAVDWSEAMISKGKSMPWGNDPKINWVSGRIEDVELHPPYALITAADSIHWMNWEQIFPLFHDVLTSKGYLVTLERSELPPIWNDKLQNIIVRYSTYSQFENYDLIEELTKRSLFEVVGNKATKPVTSWQPIEEYIASFHARAGLSNMSPENATEFDRQLRELSAPYQQDGKLQLQTICEMNWGKPIHVQSL